MLVVEKIVLQKQMLFGTVIFSKEFLFTREMYFLEREFDYFSRKPIFCKISFKNVNLEKKKSCEEINIILYLEYFS